MSLFFLKRCLQFVDWYIVFCVFSVNDVVVVVVVVSLSGDSWGIEIVYSQQISIPISCLYAVWLESKYHFFLRHSREIHSHLIFIHLILRLTYYMSDIVA